MSEQISIWGALGEQEPQGSYMELIDGRWLIRGDSVLGATINTSDAPTNPVKTRLSDILEHNVDPKYHLSEKACRGILRRAGARGKELPAILRNALMSTAGVESVEPTAFSKTAHPRNKDETQGWEESDTAHTLNLFNIGEIRSDELIVEDERRKQ